MARIAMKMRAASFIDDEVERLVSGPFGDHPLQPRVIAGRTFKSTIKFVRKANQHQPNVLILVSALVCQPKKWFAFPLLLR